MGNPDSVGIPRAQPLDQDRPVSRAWLWAVAVAVAAFLFRLVPVLRGGGLFGFGNYDDGVYLRLSRWVDPRPASLSGLPAAPSSGNHGAAGPIRRRSAADQRLVRVRRRTRGVDAAGGGERSADLEDPEADRSGRGRVRWIRLRRVPPSGLRRSFDTAGEPGHNGTSDRHPAAAATHPRRLVASRQSPRRRSAAGARNDDQDLGSSHSPDRSRLVAAAPPIRCRIAGRPRQCGHRHGDLLAVLCLGANSDVEPGGTRPALPARRQRRQRARTP